MRDWLSGYADDEGEHVSVWQTNGMEQRIREALEAVHLNSPDGHHFGRPYVSSYQLAITLAAEDGDLLGAVGKEIGGKGTGEHHSLAQYIGNELSKQIKAQGENHYAEGAFFSNENVLRIVYRGPAKEHESSLTGTPWDMALFRLRAPRECCH